MAVCIVLGACCARAEQVIVKMWMHEHPPRIAIDKTIIAAFEKSNPDVKIQYEVIPVAEYGTKLLTAFASGAGPDLFNQFSGLVAQYYNARVIAPIDFAAMGYADEAALTGQYLNGFDGARFGGRLYGIPTEVSNWACYANNRIWQEAGLDPGHDFPTTWEALPAVAEKLTQRDANGVPLRRGFDFNWSNRNAVWMTSSTMLHQLGGNIVDEASYKAALDTPAGRRVMQYWADWANKLRLGGPQYTDSRTDFLAGKLATECSFGIWGVPQMTDAKIDYTVKPAPRFADAVSDNGFDAYAFYMMVNARSPAATQKAAWKLARSYVDHASDLFSGAGLFVPRKDVMDLPAYKADPTSAVFIEELKKANFSPRVVGYDQVADTILRGRDRMVQGGEPVADVLPAMNDDMNAILRRERARAEAMFGIRPRPINRKWWGLVFVLPVVGFFALFTVFPVMFGFYLSLTDYDLLSQPEWVGFDNFRNLLSDRLFLTALNNTFVFVAGSTVPVWIASLLAALLFDQAFRGRNILKATFFLPVLPPVVVIAVVWRMLLHPNGIMTWMVGSFRGISEIRWLADTVLAPLSMIVVHDWAVIPFFMMIWLAGLAGIAPELREAAHIDGANGVRTFWHIELPQLRGTAVLVAALSTINAFQTFTLQYVLSPDPGGPANSTLVLGLLVLKYGFQYFRMGDAAAVSVVMFAIILAVTVAQLRFNRHTV